MLAEQRKRTMIGSHVRLTGAVRANGQEPVIAQAVLIAADAAPVSSTILRAFELELDDGSTVEVSCDELDTKSIYGTESNLRGRWSELEATPLARVFRGRSPGPHVRVKLRGVAATNGDRLQVVGEVIDVGAGGSDYRDSVPRRIARIRALHVGIGQSGASRIEALLAKQAPLARDKPATKLPSKKQLLIALGVLAVIAIVTKALIATPSLLLESFVVVLAAASLGFAIGREQNGIGAVEAGHVGFDLAGVLVFLGLLVLAIFDHVAAAVTGYRGNLVVATLLGVIGCASNLLGTWVGVRKARGWARVILAAPAHTDARADADEPASRGWGKSVGIVRDPTPVLVSGVPAAMARVVTEDRSNVVLDQGFELESPLGTIAVDPRDATWTSWARRGVPAREPTPPVGTEPAAKPARIVEEIPVGVTALIVGRLAHDGDCWTISATGPESLFIYVPPKDLEPIASLEGWMKLSRRALVAAAILFALAIGSLLLALMVWR